MSAEETDEDPCKLKLLGTSFGTNGDCDKFSYPHIPVEFWELQELVQNSCPAEALKTFRKTLITGKGRALNANTADAAIRGAYKACETGLAVEKRKVKRVFEPPSEDSQIARQKWYLISGLPLIWAKPYGYEFTEAELAMIEPPGYVERKVHWLAFSEESVDRVEGMWEL
jgi:hypothetical protein